MHPCIDCYDQPKELTLSVSCLRKQTLTNLAQFSIHSLSLVGKERPLKVWMEMDSEACVEQVHVLTSIHCETLHNGLGS